MGGENVQGNNVYEFCLDLSVCLELEVYDMMGNTFPSGGKVVSSAKWME
jgi:hypothetical protein